MALLLNFLHNGDGTYDCYLTATYIEAAYVLLLHGTDRQVMFYDGIYSMFGYVKLHEGDTWEYHQPSLVSGEYIKTVYTAASGTITAVEHGTSTTIVAAS
jgi:hypothetical protein